MKKVRDSTLFKDVASSSLSLRSKETYQPTLQKDFTELSLAAPFGHAFVVTVPADAWPSRSSFRTENQGKIFCPFAILPRGKSASLFFRESVSSWGKDRSRREIEGCTRVAFPFAISVIMLSSSSRRTLEGAESNRLPWLGGLRTATWKGEINQRTQRPFCSSLSFDERNGSKPRRPFVFD